MKLQLKSFLAVATLNFAFSDSRGALRESRKHQPQQQEKASEADVGILSDNDRQLTGGAAYQCMRDGFHCCQGYEACKDAVELYTGNNTCIGHRACTDGGYGNGSFSTGDNACLQKRACAGNGRFEGMFIAGSNCCDGDFACLNAGTRGKAWVGSGSCVGNYSCSHAGEAGFARIGEQSCVGEHACYYNNRHGKTNFVIGDMSCTCDDCCKELQPGSYIGDCQCTSLSHGCSNVNGPVIRPGSCPQDLTLDLINSKLGLTQSNSEIDLSVFAQTGNNNNSSGVQQYQNLTFDESTNVLGLTNSAVTVDMTRLVNDNQDELQDLQFDKTYNTLKLTKSSAEAVDLSHLENTNQHLTINSEYTKLGLTDSSLEVDVSPLRVTNLQASIVNIDGQPADKRRKAWQVLSVQPTNDELPQVKYAGEDTNGISFVSSGRLIGMSITAKFPLKDGALVVFLVDCTDLAAIKSLGTDQDSVELNHKTGSRTHTVRFSSPIPIDMGTILCLEVKRWAGNSGGVYSTGDSNAANIVLMAEQW